MQWALEVGNSAGRDQGESLCRRNHLDLCHRALTRPALTIQHCDVAEVGDLAG